MFAISLLIWSQSSAESFSVCFLQRREEAEGAGQEMAGCGEAKSSVSMEDEVNFP
jgi:hypothetical protein